MDNSLLPNVGDIITFSGMWHASLNVDKDGRFPNGIVTAIVPYDAMESFTSDSDFWGTLAYPLTINNVYIDSSVIFIVHWATDNHHIASSYRLINEEWFYNESFRIVSRA
tara:strand:+ start:4267 stop:4596 length:330 start_codon:yes stop_codon:yes gene_type:complete